MKTLISIGERWKEEGVVGEGFVVAGPVVAGRIMKVLEVIRVEGGGWTGQQGLRGATWDKACTGPSSNSNWDKWSQEAKESGEQELAATCIGSSLVQPTFAQQISGNILTDSLQCFKCGWVGHFTASCNNETYCFICKGLDHVYRSYPLRKNPLMAKFYGFGGEETVYFFHTYWDEEQSIIEEFKNGVIISSCSGILTKEILEKRFLRNVIPDGDWVVKMMDDTKFMVKVPDRRVIEAYTISNLILEMLVAR